MPQCTDLNPYLHPYCKWMMAVGRHFGPTLVITSSVRSKSEQARLYERYLRGDSPIPALPPGRSTHEFGHAWDMARPGVDPLTDELLFELGELWRWLGGRWGGPTDPVHFGV